MATGYEQQNMPGGETEPDAGNATDGASRTLLSDAKEAAQPLKESLTQAIDQQRDAGAHRLDVIAGVISDAAPRLEQQMPQLATYVRDAGAWVRKSADDIRQQRFEELLQSAGNFARSNPAAAFGAAALSGFVIARFLKSGSQPANSNDGPGRS